MDPDPLEVLGQPDQSPGDTYRWLPTMSVEPGMITARPIVGLFDVRETMYVAIGSTITVSTIAQMLVKGVECVAVFDNSTQELVGDDHPVSTFEMRLKEIFGTEPNAACRALMDALAIAQSTLR